MEHSTIAAIATAPGAGGIAVVRLSGPESYAVAAKVFHPANPAKRVEDAKGYTALFGHFMEGEEAFDEGVALFFRAPHSYTGEDVVELSCHGGSAVARRLVESCIAAGAAPAAPGEYTRRAFLNGKLGLTQAEAVMDLISADGRQGAALANASLNGALAKKIGAEKDALTALQAHLAAWVDFPEEDVPELDEAHLRSVLGSVQETLDGLIRNYQADTVLREGVDCAIVGRPNAGKSSLTNKLTNNDRSIVSNVAGTTRDAIDTMVEHEGQFYTIVDTAGLRKKSVIDEDVEYYGFVRAMRAIDRAEVVLLVIDSTIGLTDQDQRVAGMAAERGCAMVVVLNKWDLVEGPDAKAEVRERIEDRLKFVGYAPVIAISALSGKNVQRIWGAINEAHANYSKSISTSRLNNWLQDIREFGHTISKGKRILKLKYVTQTGVQPPFFTFFCNHPDLVEPSFERYLENRLRSTFDFTGTPINLKFKKKD